MTTTDSDRLLAAGVPMLLTDGREVHLKYGMRSYKTLEDQYGSLGGAEKALSEALHNGGAVLGPLMDVLSAGLIHEKISADDLLDLLDMENLDDYVSSLFTAFEQASPATRGKAKAAANKMLGSTGRSTTGSRQSNSGARIKNSGI